MVADRLDPLESNAGREGKFPQNLIAGACDFCPSVTPTASTSVHLPFLSLDQSSWLPSVVAVLGLPRSKAQSPDALFIETASHRPLLAPTDLLVSHAHSQD